MHGTPRLPLRCRCLGSQCLATLGRHWLHRTPGNVNFSWEKKGNVQTLELKQNIRLDEPKTEKNYSTQHTDAKGQIKRHTWLAETEGRVFKAEHANLQRQPWQCSFPQHSTVGWDVHQVGGGGGWPCSHLYLHHPVLRHTGAQALHWRLRLVACHQKIKTNQLSLYFYVNFRRNLKH